MGRGYSPTARVLAVTNQKGGVGKTTTAINLSTALTACGHRVLIIDLDPQANATTGLGIDRGKRETIYEVLIGRTPIEQVVVETQVPGLAIVPSSIALSAAEVELSSVPRSQYCLRECLRGLLASYDDILIDCPPALGFLTVNALVAAHSVLVPLQSEFYALEGLSHLMRTIDLIRNKLNASLELQGVVLTMYDARNKLSSLVEADARQHLGDVVYDTIIPRNVRLSEAPSHGKPVLLYDDRCIGSKAYLHLAQEMLTRERRVVPVASSSSPKATPQRSGAVQVRDRAALRREGGVVCCRLSAVLLTQERWQLHHAPQGFVGTLDILFQGCLAFRVVGLLGQRQPFERGPRAFARPAVQLGIDRIVVRAALGGRLA